MATERTGPRRLPIVPTAFWLLATLVGAAAGAAAPDLVHVYYGGRDCRGDVLELEVYDRDRAAWVPHPEHPRAPARSCQREDAGRLLNELRWRCQPESDWAPTPWRALDVFEPEVMARCAVGQIDPAERRSAISVDSPREGATLTAQDAVVQIEGSVRVDGVDGHAYDVVLLVDRSAGAGALEAQVAAARAFVRRIAPRLGPVRVAIVSHPNRPPQPGGSVAFRVEIGPSTRAEALDAALAAVARRPSPGPSAAAEAIDAAVALLGRSRPAARPVLLIGMDGAELDDAEAPAPDDPLLLAARRAAERGAELHWFALGGVASEAPPRVRRALEAGPGSFRRVPPPHYGRPYLGLIALPVAEALWVENHSLDARGVGAVDPSGRFAARSPVRAGRNELLIRARLSDGSEIQRPFELVFDDALVLQKILQAERERILEARQKRLDLDVEE